MENFRRYARVFGTVLATVTAIGILANLNDIRRYVRISMM